MLGLIVFKVFALTFWGEVVAVIAGMSCTACSPSGAAAATRATAPPPWRPPPRPSSSSSSSSLPRWLTAGRGPPPPGQPPPPRRQTPEVRGGEVPGRPARALPGRRPRGGRFLRHGTCPQAPPGYAPAARLDAGRRLPREEEGQRSLPRWGALRTRRPATAWRRQGLPREVSAASDVTQGAPSRLRAAVPPATRTAPHPQPEGNRNHAPGTTHPEPCTRNHAENDSPGSSRPERPPRPRSSSGRPPVVHRSDPSSLKLFWIAGTPCRLIADATLASRIGGPHGGRDTRSSRSRYSIPIPIHPTLPEFSGSGGH